MSDDNPYAPPSAESQVAGIVTGRPGDLWNVAFYQKGVLICILLYAIPVVCQMAVLYYFFPSSPIPPAPFWVFMGFEIMIGLGVLAVMLAGVILVILLAMKVYGPGPGTLLALLTFFPFTTWLVLLFVSMGATRVLRRNGIKVGLLGADLSKIKRGGQI
jgi:hypothetical protein